MEVVNAKSGRKFYTGLLLPEKTLARFQRANEVSKFVLPNKDVMDIVTDRSRIPSAEFFSSPHWAEEGDQHQHNSCAGWGGANAFSKAAYLLGLNEKQTVYSGSFPYSFCNRNMDQGAVLEDVMHELMDKGTVPAAKCGANNIWRAQCSQFDAEALNHRAIALYAAATQAEVNSALARRQMVVVCVNVDANQYVNYNGVGLVPEFNGRGNHCIHVDDIRWNEITKEYEYRQFGNWGRDWGFQGTGWCTWRSFKQPTQYHMFYVLAGVQNFDLAV